jgi:hypothetical protein
VERVERDAEGQGEGGHAERAGADHGEGGVGVAREEGGVLVRHEEPQVEGDRDSQERPRARPAAEAIQPQTEAEVGGDRDEHDEDEARLAPAVEDQAHAEEPEIAKTAASGEVAGED